ncbi:dTDP-glucose 4,6-dehydratase [Maricaulis sp.]|uniref:dTDP-glucose 4,6-dehydratase n=1 Tax=Maricaulis sp. TaxID=1486257 RepID=UPI003A9453AB
MKILITGGCGFIGSAVVLAALERGHDVVNLDALTYAANPANLASVEDNPAYRFEQADIRDGAALEAILARHQPDAVMHLAAESHVDRSIDGPQIFVDTNVGGTAQLLRASTEYRKTLASGRADAFRFHHVSTDEVYGSLGATGRFTEDSPYRPNSPYAASKASADMMVRAWHETYGLPVVISNCSNNYGPRQFPEKLIPVVILSALSGAPIPVYGRGANVRDWLHVEDHADALLAILERGRIGETYNVGGDAERSNLDLIKLLCAELDRQSPRQGASSDLITFVADRPGHDFRYAIDASKLHRELGWSPRLTLEDGLARTVRWYLDHDAWCRQSLARVGSEASLQRLGLGPKP